MHTGELYYPNKESIFDEQLKKLDLSTSSIPRARLSRRDGRR